MMIISPKVIKMRWDELFVKIIPPLDGKGER